MKSSYFSPDILEFLSLLFKHKVKYLIVGGEAVIYYGHTRLTSVIDIFYEASQGNTGKLYEALEVFWNHDIPGLKDKQELLEPGVIIQFGVPPNRIDLINTIEKISFEEAWPYRVNEKVEDEPISIYYIGIEQLIKNKEALARPKDIDDLNYLKQKTNDKCF